MALDGITVANIVYELKTKLLNGRIDKIYQPLPEEIIFGVRCAGENFKILLSANSSQPRVHITKLQKENPMKAPMFCMVLRKHISGGKIVDITQPRFERIIQIKIESFNEMGDKAVQTLAIEIMGKHSNIILVGEDGRILDSIKHITHEKSSVREVLPQKEYVLPPSQGKKDPTLLDKTEFFALCKQAAGKKLEQFLYQSYTGISPVMACEICARADLDASLYCSQLEDATALYQAFYEVMEAVKANRFAPEMILERCKSNKPIEFCSLPLTLYHTFGVRTYPEISPLLEQYYGDRDKIYHIKQRAFDMRRLVLSNIERCVKKRDIQEKSRQDTKHKDDWRIKGELLTAHIHQIEKGVSVFHAPNFYEEGMPLLEIALDATKSPSENAQRYFNKYNKAKRTLAALEIQKEQNDEELRYLESVLLEIETAKEYEDLVEIRQELAQSGYVKRKNTGKNKAQQNKKSKPLQYISSDNLPIYIGKNNVQNDELTLHFASAHDIWMHTKDIPGSHVIVKLAPGQDLPDNTLLEAANLAAIHSKAKEGSNVPVDYALRKFVKKPSGAKPGMVIYEQNKTVYVTPTAEFLPKESTK